MERHCHRGEKTIPMYEVWKNIVTKGYVHKTLHQYMKYGKVLSQRVKKEKEPEKTGSLELRIAGSMKKI